MRDAKSLNTGILCGAVLVLVGCASTLEPVRPALPVAGGYALPDLPTQTVAAGGAGGQAQRFVTGAAVQADWWTLFRSPALNALVEHGLVANPSLTAAEAALRNAQELLAVQRTAYAPTVQAAYTPTRTKLAANSGNTGPGNGALNYTFHSAQLSVGYAPDVFGATKAQVLTADAQAQIQQLQWQAARVSLATNIVGAAVQDASLRRQIALTQQTVAAAQHALELLQRQQQAGQVASLEVANQALALAQARQLLPPLRRQLEINRDLLRALTASAPDSEVTAFDLDDLQLPAELPLSLPGALLEQRPDVQAAWQQLRGAAGQLGLAQAHRLPQFAISADVGSGAASLARIFSPGGLFFDVTAHLVQTVFDAGALQHREQAARETLRGAVATYQATVITAYQNVADSLQALHGDAEAMQAADEATRAAHSALELTQRQTRLGYLDGLAAAAAQQSDLQAASAVAQARSSRLMDSAALFQALGGGI